MNRGKIIIFSLIAVIILIIGFFIFHHKTVNVTKNQTKKESTTETVSATTTNSSLTQEKAVSYLTDHNQGLPKETDLYEKNMYLSLTQTGTHTYDSTYTGDRLVWIYEKNGKNTIVPLSDSTYLIKVIKNRNSPFLHIGNETFIVFYQHINLENEQYNMNGYVYRVKSDGSLEKVYQTQNAFYDFQFKSDSMLMVEKIYNDPLNQYSTPNKPYDLVYTEYKNGQWNIVKKESVKK